MYLRILELADVFRTEEDGVATGAAVGSIEPLASGLTTGAVILALAFLCFIDLTLVKVSGSPAFLAGKSALGGCNREELNYLLHI